MPAHPSRDRDAADVLDHDTGKVRVLARRCATCIFRPGDPMHLGAERVREVIEENLRAGALLTCHATLPYGDRPDFGPAVCAGFWAHHRNAVPAGRLAQLALGIIKIQPPHQKPNQKPTAPGSPSHLPQDPSRKEKDGPGPHPGCGDRIQQEATSDPYTALEPGALGTVTGVDSLGTIQVRCDNGSTLGLVPDIDRFNIISL